MDKMLELTWLHDDGTEHVAWMSKEEFDLQKAFFHYKTKYMQRFHPLSEKYVTEKDKKEFKEYYKKKFPEQYKLLKLEEDGQRK